MPEPNQEEMQKLRWLLEKLQNSEDFCRPYFDRAKRHYKLYRFGSAVKDDDWPYVNRVRSRDILAFVEDTTALMIQTLFATSPFYSILPRETSMITMKHEGIDPLRIGKQMERCLDYQVAHEDTEFFEEMVDFFKGGHIFGNAYMGVYPKFVNGEYLRPLLKAIDYWDVMPIAGARRASKAKGMFVREFVSIGELFKDQSKGIYKNVGWLKSPESTGTDAEKNWHQNLLQEVGMTSYVQESNNVEVIHYFSGGHVITIGDRKRILRKSNVFTYEKDSDELVIARPSPKPFPYDQPIVMYKYMNLPLEWFAMGIPEVLEALQEDKNLIRSARRDNIDLVIQKVLKVRSGADVNWGLLKYYAGALWPLESLTDVEPLETSDVTQSSYQEESMREHDMENALSLFGYARGMTPTHQEQPTTVMKLQQASLNRLDLAVKMAEFTTLQNIATRIILLTRRFMTPQTYEAIIGERDAGFFKLSEEDIRKFYYIKPVGSSVTNIKELRQQQIAGAIQLLQSIPPELAANNVTPFTVDWYEALNAALESTDIKNRERILVDLSQQEEELRQQQEAAQMMQGMQQEMQQLSQVGYGG